MYYEIRAYNSNPLYAYADNENDVDRYTDWLNRNRDINHYTAKKILDKDIEIDEGVVNMNEPYWDDFMID